MRRALVLTGCLVSLGAACPAPRDTTPPIRVAPRAAGRFASFMGQRPAGAPAAKAARVHVMVDGEQLGGPNAIGCPGDLVLENGEVVFVIDRLGSSAGFAETGGDVVDAADASVRKDELGQQFTYFGTFPRQGVYDALSSGTSPDGSAWVEARGRELYESNLLVTTRYTLQPPDRALLIETTVENAGAVPIDSLSLGDVIQWGGTEKIAPGMPRDFKGSSSGPYLGGVGRFTSYAITSTEGAIDGVSGNSWTDTTQRRGVRLGPGQKTSYARVLVVGERPDSSSLIAELAKSAGQRVGAVAVDLRPSEGETAVAVPPDARVSVQSSSGAEVITIHAAGAPPRLEGELPPGHWLLAYTGGGGRAGQGTAVVDVVAGETARAQLVVSRPAGARIRCVDAGAGGSPMPCKVTFERTDGGGAPDFGPAHVAGPARNQATASDGVVDVELAWGSYRVTASRGPEYALARAEVKLAPGERTELRLSPLRVVDTSGYVACDFHQHTMLGADAPVTTRDRVIANAAEGVEVAVASEHNVVADLEPVVRALHLERELVSIPGDEITSDASRHAWGHANVFPMPFDPAKPHGGAPAVRDRSPRDLFGELRSTLAADFVVQVNHPRSGQNGYFDRLGFDPATGLGTDPGYEARFDALEVWNGRNVDTRARVLGDFLALLRTRRPVTPTADTDTHGVVGQEAGYPRTYVRVPDDKHFEAWDGARTQEVVRGVKALRDVVLTNGPMLRVTANGAPIGAAVSGRIVEVKVHVESAPWVAVDEVRLVRASVPDAPVIRRVVEKPTPGGALAADTVFTVRATVDDAFVVIASGSVSMAPVLAGTGGNDPELLPWAMTGAIWIDADGDGRSLGR
jgi:hypothetical protein